MRKLVPLAAAAAAAVIALAVPAAASVPRAQHAGRPAICRVVAQRVTDGRTSLDRYARQMHSTPVQVLLISGMCTGAGAHYPAAVDRYRDFTRPFPAHVRLFGPLFG